MNLSAGTSTELIPITMSNKTGYDSNITVD